VAKGIREVELYFFRHGDAEAAAATGDADRRLTERGRRETLAVALALHRAGLRPEAIISSPLLRARQTAEILQEVFALPAQADRRLSPGCSLGAIQELASHHPLGHSLLVGHEPDLGRIVGQLLGGAHVSMAKSGVARVDADRVEPGTGVLVWLLSPELLAER
jgi:phosphohistidine phosphatase